MPSKDASKNNGKFGGRPKISPQEKIQLSAATHVILTRTQYDKLSDKYGKELVENAVSLLDDRLACGNTKWKQYLGKNHYAHFRSDGWLINNTRYLMTKSHQTNS